MTDRTSEDEIWILIKISKTVLIIMTKLLFFIHYKCSKLREDVKSTCRRGSLYLVAKGHRNLTP